MEDSLIYQGKREKLIKSLRQKNIRNEEVLQAMMRVPRHFFFNSALFYIAYEDRAFPISAQQTISQPWMVARQTELLNITSKHPMKILEIGTGSGYQACVLAQMNMQVFSIERQKELFLQLKNFQYIKQYTNLSIFYGDGFEGIVQEAPFDRIIITAGASVVPIKLIEQLKINGIMVLPFGKGEQQILRITKTGNNTIEREFFESCTFVPMLPGKV
ncbi:MAG: protein-L-isoaspartate(D-aspartate) O-methyltransferase [Chitinophagaceae bacterium]